LFSFEICDKKVDSETCLKIATIRATPNQRHHTQPMAAPSSKCANRRDFFCTGQTLCPHRAGGIGAPVGAPYAPGRNVLSLPRKQGFFVAEYPVAEGKKRELVARLDEHRRDDAGADGRSGAAGGAGCAS
jgi:hypothetical protein